MDFLVSPQNVIKQILLGKKVIGLILHP